MNTNVEKHGTGINTDKITAGDRIKFRSWTRDHCRDAVRIVTGRDYLNRITVRYFGTGGFIVYDHEIIEHYPQGAL